MRGTKHTVSVMALVEGEAALSDVFTSGGRKVLAAGATLDKDAIAWVRRLCGKSFVAPVPWPMPTPKTKAPPAKTDAAFDSIRKGYAKREGGDRQHDRSPWCASARVTLREPGAGVRTLTVTTCDVSRGGFAFLAEAFVHVGTEVEAVLENRPETVLRGVVRSCAHVEGVRHRVGVQFSEKRAAA